MNDTNIDGQRALADPVRARTLIVLHDDGPVASELELLLALIEPQGITEVHRVTIDPDDPNSVLSALDIVLGNHTRSRPDFVIIACERESHGVPVRGLTDPTVLARVADLPIPVATLPGPHGSPIDAAVWRAFADINELDQHVMTLLGREVSRAELVRLQAISALFMCPDTPPPSSGNEA